MSEPTAVLFRAFDQAADLVAAVTPEQAGLPTPCAEFDVATLIGHLVGGVGRCAAIATDGNPFAAPKEVDLAPTDWAKTFSAAANGAVAAWSDPAVLDREVTLPFGTMSGRRAAAWYAVEMVAHTWDLAAATGRRDRLDPALAEAVLPAARQALVGAERPAEVPFANAVPVPADADPYTALSAWLGRSWPA